jgi:hypothetical protein
MDANILSPIYSGTLTVWMLLLRGFLISAYAFDSCSFLIMDVLS